MFSTITSNQKAICRNIYSLLFSTFSLAAEIWVRLLHDLGLLSSKNSSVEIRVKGKSNLLQKTLNKWFYFFRSCIGGFIW